MYGLGFFFFLDDPLPRQNTQAQAAEDILDKYRNIKRTSPSDGAAAGASYDGTGGQGKTKHTIVYICTVQLLHTLASDKLSKCCFLFCFYYDDRSLC